jgi:hypothetical protein
MARHLKEKGYPLGSVYDARLVAEQLAAELGITSARTS